MAAAVWMTALMASLSVLDYNPLSLLMDSMSPCYVNFPIFSIADWSGIASQDLSSKLLILKITACHPPIFSFLLKWIFIPFCMFQRGINTMLGVLSITPKKSRIEISICKWRKARIFFFFHFLVCISYSYLCVDLGCTKLTPSQPNVSVLSITGNLLL